MDSITQFALGASVGLAVSPVKSPKIAIISGLIATIPDLDIFINYGDDLTNTIKHRGFSHSLIYLTIFAPFLALFLHKFIKTISYYRWAILSWLVLITHPILDSFTIYGTSLLLPISDIKVMIGSIFVIDLLYTIPLLISFIYLLIKKRLPIIKNISLNNWGLIFSTIYLVLTFTTQQIIKPVGKSFATPTPFNAFIWRVVEVDKDFISQHFINLLGEKSKVLKVKNNQHLKHINIEAVNKYTGFSSGFYNLQIIDNKLILQDLRFMSILNPVFSFVIAKKVDDKWIKTKPTKLPRNLPIKFNNFKSMFWQK
jgi:inner membrane protein